MNKALSAFEIVALQEENTAFKWISVKDRLPTEGRVLLYCPVYGEHDVMQTRIVEAQFTKICSDATHWMHLPKPPKE